jgi:hypothetical protein
MSKHKFDQIVSKDTSLDEIDPETLQNFYDIMDLYNNRL